MKTMKFFSILIPLHFTLVATAPLGKLRTYNWHISRFVEAPDGVQVSRLGINGRAGVETVIGEKLRRGGHNIQPLPTWLRNPDVNVGDVVKVFVTNGLDVPTSLHWHGITQKNTVAMDGPAMVTQCPIPPGSFFEYTWNATDAGTFWWHGHYRGQEDHFYTNSEEEIAGYLVGTSAVMTGVPPNSDEFSQRPGAMMPLPPSGLLNHRGIPHRSASENTELSAGQHMLVGDIHFQPGRRYLLRVINAAAVVPFNFAIDAHRLTIVQADATDVVDNVTVDGLFIDIGQRYSVIIMPITKWRRPLEVLGTVTYAGADTSLPPASQETTEPEFLAENGLQLQNRVSTPAPDLVHRSYVFAWDFHADESGRDNSGVTRGWISINVTRPLTTSDGVTYIAPTVPTLFLIADGTAPDALPETTIPFSAETDETIDLIFMNREFPPHPMHLHGHTVWVLGSGQAAAYEDIPFAQFNLRNPLRRDTFTVPSGSRDGTVFGWTVVRTTADNPGVWFLHCHLEFHIIAGLAMTFVSGAQTVRERGVPEANRELCNAFAKWQSRPGDLAISSTASAAAALDVNDAAILVVQT
ncbi:ferroxidase fet3 [Geranomyces michiganensis]|nr:ferroxidase fet3 [Geranomyces michiganensis]